MTNTESYEFYAGNFGGLTETEVDEALAESPEPEPPFYSEADLNAMELEEHIKRENEASRVQLEELRAKGEQIFFWGETVTDPKHWAEYGVYTVEQYEVFCIRCDYSDLHKDVFGVKDHLAADITLEEARRAYDNLLEWKRGDEEWKEECEAKRLEEEREGERKRKEALDTSKGDSFIGRAWLETVNL